MRRWFIVALLVSLCYGLLVAALTPAAASQTVPPKILRIWWGELPESLEPQQTDFGQRQVVDLAYEGLTRLDEELTPVPGAAESWQFSDDGLTLAFHLRDGLVYSDGSPLTAERFRYAVERQCDPHNDFSDVVTLFVIVGCEALNESLTSASDEAAYEAAKTNLGIHALDERTLEIQLTRRVPSFLAIASGSGFRPVKQEIVEAEGPDWWRDPANWVGNGPFNVASLDLDADIPRVGLARNVRYWGGSAKLDGIEYAVMDFEAAWDAYLNGDLDVLPLVSDAMSRIENDPVLSRELMSVRATYAGVFLLNMTREPFQDKKVREAFAYAFDRHAYCREVEFGTCTPTFSWIPPGVPGSIETAAYAFDPERARLTLAESTYGGPENVPEVTWYVTDGDDWGAMQAQWLADQFHSVLGVELLLTPITEDEADAMLWVDSESWPQFGSFFWYSDLPDPSGWLDFWLCDSDAFAIYIGYCNPEFDALYARADSELDPERRIELFEEAGHMLVADVPSIFVYNPTNAWLVKPYVTGYSRTAPQQQWPGWWAPLQVDLTPSS